MKSKGRLQWMKRLAAFVLAAVLVLGIICSADAIEIAKKKKKTGQPTVTAVPAAETAAPDAGTEGSAENPGEEPTETPEATEEPGPIIEPQRIADYLFEHGELPENFITKQEARELGWDSSYNYVSDVAPGMSIGGDYFGNYEGKLPKVKGRKYYECDCWYTEGRRSQYRIIYSNDGHVWYTEDHYNTFTEMSPSEP